MVENMVECVLSKYLVLSNVETMLPVCKSSVAYLVATVRTV
jgi:hypothetical protein